MYYVYILSNSSNTVVYIGMTNDLSRRVYEHKNHLAPNSFTARYQVTKLVYYEVTENVNSAIEREKQLKGWNRKRKDKAISLKNPEWKDLYEDILL